MIGRLEKTVVDCPDPLGVAPGEDRWPSDAQAPGAADRSRRCRAGERPPRVLLVDDSPTMRRVLRGLLEDAGIPVVGEAVDGPTGSSWPCPCRPTWC
jgi:hypothetical protein